MRTAVKPCSTDCLSRASRSCDSGSCAERDGVVRAVHVKSGETIAARDLLVEFS
jgi:pyruvate carboxylase